MHSNSLILDFAVVFGVATIIVILTHKFKLPTTLGYILAGIVVGPYIPIPLFADPARIEQISELGVILVLFSIGLEFNIKKFILIMPKVGIGAGIQMISLFSVGIISGQIFGWGVTTSITLGACIAISSTVISHKSMDSSKICRATKEYVYGILVIQDLIGILVITVLSTIIAGNAVEMKLLWLLIFKMIAFVILVTGIGIVIVPRVAQAILKFNSRETIIILSCGVCFTFSYLADYYGFSVALGAFLGGMLISETGRGRYFDENISQIKSMFSTIFFISVGMSLDPRIFIQNIHFAIILSFIIIICMLISVTLGGILSGYGMKTSIISGLSLGQVGEFSFIISSLALSAKLVDINFYSIVVATSAITAITTPLLLKRHMDIVSRVEQFLPDRLKSLMIIYLNWLNSNRESDHSKNISYSIKIIIYSVIMIVLSLVMTILFPSLGKYVSVIKIPFVSRKHLYPLLEFLVISPFLILMLLSANNCVKKLTDQHFYNIKGKVTFLNLMKFSVIIFVLVILTLILMITTLPLGKISFFSVFMLLSIVAVFCYVLWARSSDLQDQLEKSLDRFFRSFFLGHRGNNSQAVDIKSQLLPNLEDVNILKLNKDFISSGITISDLNLRGKTGATILYIVRGQQHIYLPAANEILLVNDLVALVGGEDSVAKAIKLLSASHLT